MLGTHYATSGKQNNFLVIRYLAATLVVLNHCFSIISGSYESEIFVRDLGRSLGNYAVDVFFIVSGFVVFQSLLRNENLIDFVAARMLRIFPALCVVVIASVFFLGPVLTNQPISQYFTSVDIVKYLVGTLTTLKTDLSLPGVFMNVPEVGKINTPLWTLKYEIAAYASLICLALASAMLGRSLLKIGIVISVFGLSFISIKVGEVPANSLQNLAHLALCFYLGAAAYLLRQFLPLNILGVALIALIAALSHGSAFGQVTAIVFLAYSALWLAFVPNLFHPGDGDYSYGIYIFAFPIQQTLYYVWTPQSPLVLFMLTMIITLPAAAASWHLVEKPSLKARTQIVETFSSWFASSRGARSNI